MTSVEVLDDEAAVAGFVDAWDALALEARRPYCAPAWMLGWWRHAAPPGARLRVAAVLDGPQLIAIAPLYEQKTRLGLSTYHLLASQISSRTEPLAAPGHEREAARLLADRLSRLRPPADLVAFNAVDVTSRYPADLVEAWPGRRPHLHRDHTIESPYVSLEGRTLDDWYASKSRNFREQVRRRRRQLDRAGATFALAATHAETARAVRAFIDLHHRRWSWRGGSGVLTPGVERMLLEVAPPLVEAGRMRLWTIEVEERVISAHVFLGVVDEFTYWLGGFDDAWAAQQPALQSLVAAVEHAFGAGDRLLDLGAGGQHYKYRLADGDAILQSTNLVPAGGKAGRVRALLWGRRARRGVVEHLPPRVRRELRRLRARYRSLRG